MILCSHCYSAYEFFKDFSPIIVAAVVLAFQLYHNKKTLAENTFFNLLNSIRSLVSKTSGLITKEKKENETFTNRTTEELATRTDDQYFLYAKKELQRRLNAGYAELVLGGLAQKEQKQRDEEYKKMAQRIYNKFFDEHVTQLGHYFRFVYNVINYVDKKCVISDENKKEYINFIQSQMSANELYLIFFNGIGKYGAKFHALIDKYNFLENIDSLQIDHPNYNDHLILLLTKFYPHSSFRFNKNQNFNQ